MSRRDFKKKIREAISDPNLKKALDRSAAAYSKARAEALEGLDFESLRENLRSCKESSVKQIPELFVKFRTEAEKVGVIVHEASDAKSANEIALEIIRSNDGKKIVKSKSMLTEETELNRYLLDAGLEVVETDLGEWICQLAGEKPSHFTAPAIHKTREEIAEIFSRATGEKIEPDIPTLVEVARKQIRQAFIEADIGISGANIAIAETGTLVLISNEGNARLVTSLPEIHIAMVGYDKLVPSLDEATAIIKLLSKCGTGQKMTSYVSFITGPSRTSDIEKTLTLGCHGPREVHVIFVDNGRLALLEQEDFQEALYCVKCGACLNVCPVFRSVGGHVFGHTYVGGIGAILTAFYNGLSVSEDIVDLCASCGRCKANCPAKINIPRMIASLRHKKLEECGQPWFERLIFRNILANPERFDQTAAKIRRVQNAFLPRKKTLNLPFPMSLATGGRELPLLAEKPFSEIMPNIITAKSSKKGRAAFFPGCVIEHVYPEIGKSAIEVLTKLGWETILPANQGCCGIPAKLKGDKETARELAWHNVRMKEFADADLIITACPTCMTALKKDFPELLKEDKSAHELAKGIAEKVQDIVQLAYMEVIDDSVKLNKHSHAQETVTYHDPCHAKHSFGISEEPRKLIELAGYNLVEMQDADVCCGFAGSYSITHHEVSKSILDRKQRAIAETGATMIVTSCPGCIMQLKSVHKSLKVRHIVEILSEAIE